MSSISLNIGLKSLLSAQAALEIIGHNVSNANTPGFSRQQLELASGRPMVLRGLSIGGGVNAQTVRRTVDALLARRISSQVSSLARMDSALILMAEAESLLGEPSGFGLSQQIENFFSGINTYASNPDDNVLATGVVQSASGLTSRFNQLANGMDVLRRDTFGQVQLNLQDANLLSQRIADLNQEISSLEPSGVPANDLRDKRDLAINELAAIVNVTAREQPNGNVQVFVSGQMLVGSRHASEILAELSANGEVVLRVAGSTKPVEVSGGRIGGLLEFSQGFAPGVGDQLDTLARNMILELNRVHSTGVPQSGPMTRLTGTNALQDQDGDGDVLDEFLARAGLPFEIHSGELYVNVTDEASGAVFTHRIEIDANRTTVADLLARIDAIDNLSASIDEAGRLQVLSEGGFGFDFSARLNRSPDVYGSFGSEQASLATSAAGPYSLADGDTLDLSGPLGPFTVTFSASDFDQISQASASEIADVLNANSDIGLNGLQAVVVADRVVLQSQGTGLSATFDVDGGSALGAFGWSAGTTVSGHQTSVGVEISGNYTGGANDAFTFVANGDGTVGTTPGLQVHVYDSQGVLVSSLDVGEDYQLGTELEVRDGIKVSFGFGQLSVSNNDVFTLDVIADSDPTDSLVALGMNALLTGTSAADIALREDIELDPSLLVTSVSGAAGDNTALLDFLTLQNTAIEELSGMTFGEFYGGLVSQVGFDIESTNEGANIENFLLDNLNARREQVSGVNVDEELVNMIQFEQAFAASSRFIQVVNNITDELMALL